MGARDFLVAYNVNLNTTSSRRANAIAFDVREKGRTKREGNSLTGKIVRDIEGNPVMIPGSLKCVKGIGWYIEEYGITQISMNLTNISVTPVHVAFDEVCKKADARGVRVTGSELVGLIPLDAMLEAGRYFLKKQKRSLGISDKEIIKIAVRSMGLDDLSPFNPDEKIIEYVLAASLEKQKKLVELSTADFIYDTASESPAPGGGSVSAYMGALGAAMGTMVANHSAHKKGWDDRWEEYSNWAEKGKEFHDELLRLVDEDTNAFNGIMDAYGLPAKTDSDIIKRNQAIQEATRYAIKVPLKVMKTAYGSFSLIKAMAETGNPSLISDAGVGALAARSAVKGAYLNVRINTVHIIDKGFVEEVLHQGSEIENQAQEMEKEILEIVNSKIRQVSA